MNVLRRQIIGSLCALVWACTTAHLAVATVPPTITLFSNVYKPVDPNGGGVLFGEIFANAFVTGSQATSVTSFGLRAFNGNPFLPTTGLRAFMYDNNAGIPGALLGTFTPVDTDLSAGQPDKFLTFSHSGINLQAQHTYWVAITSDQQYGWEDTRSIESDPSGNIFTLMPAGERYSGDGGRTWDALGQNNYIFELRGQVVPEPASLI